MAITKLHIWPQKRNPRDVSISMEEYLKSLGSIVGLEQLLENVSAKLREILGAKTVYIVLHEPITNRYIGRKVKGDNAGLLSQLNFSRLDNLIKWLNVNRCPLDVENDKEIVKFLSPQEQSLLRSAGAILIVPLIALNRLIGVIFLTEKTNGEVYSPPDIEILSTLAGRSGLAIEHGAMHEFQEDRLKRVLHADKLAIAGELAAGAAHEIRNPLTSIRSTMQYIRKDLPDDRRTLIDGLIGEVDRIDHIIDGLLSFSRASDLRTAPVDIADVLEQTLLLLESELKKHSANIQKHFSTGRQWVLGDASQLKQVFLNVLLNSIQAFDNGGTVTISVGQSMNHPRIVTVTIRDSGTGISEKDLSKVFDPFYTTKSNGTGLGLSISYGIVSKHGGEIEIQSDTEGPKKGTTVTIRLPQSTVPPDGGIS